jgi:thioredoxin reductase (NADPH)
MVISGGGPAGPTAEICAGRARLHAALLEKFRPRVAVVDPEVIVIYPGFPEGISGFQLSEPKRIPAAHLELLMDNGEVSETISGQPVHAAVMEGRRLTSSSPPS